MSFQHHIYTFEFDGNTFAADDQNRTVVKNSFKELDLTGKQFDILKLLMNNYGQLVRKQTFFDELWDGVFVEEQNLKRQISDIKKALNSADIIKTVNKTRNSKIDNGGYIFKPIVIITPKIQTAPSAEILLECPDAETETEMPGFSKNFAFDSIKFIAYYLSLVARKFSFDLIALTAVIYSFLNFFAALLLRIYSNDSQEQTVFIFIAGIFYGCLVGIGVLLESAYQFDKFGWNASVMAIVIAFLNFCTMVCGLSTADYFLETNTSLAFFAGFVVLLLGAANSCLLAWFVVPNTPLTAARFQTQPAFTAFCKNILIYFLPIYTVFGLLLFCLIYGSQETAGNIAFPVALAVLWLVLLAFSYLATNYLSDNLLTTANGLKYKYHGLFSALLLFRMVFCFIPSLLGIVWYFLKIV
jgi:DNA-binding winged helix-turn-helix (wHTH) protein